MSVRIRFVTRTGRAMDTQAEVGERLLDAALDALVPGIIGQCGGGITCATCRVNIGEAWLAKLEDQDPDEIELLSYVDGAGQASRLACQIRLTEELDELEVRVPGSLD